VVRGLTKSRDQDNGKNSQSGYHDHGHLEPRRYKRGLGSGFPASSSLIRWNAGDHFIGTPMAQLAVSTEEKTVTARKNQFRSPACELRRDIYHDTAAMPCDG